MENHASIPPQIPSPKPAPPNLPPANFYTHETALSAPKYPHLILQSIKYPSLTLRTPKHEDNARVLHTFSAPENIEHDKSAAGLDTFEAIEELINEWSTFNMPHPRRCNMVVCVDGVVCGVGGLGWISEHKEGEPWIGDAGIMLDVGARRKGYAYEALRMSIDWGIRVLGVDEMTVGCTSENKPMFQLMEKKFGLGPEKALEKLQKWGSSRVWHFPRDEWLERAEREGWQ